MKGLPGSSADSDAGRGVWGRQLWMPAAGTSDPSHDEAGPGQTITTDSNTQHPCACRSFPLHRPSAGPKSIQPPPPLCQHFASAPLQPSRFGPFAKQDSSVKHRDTPVLMFFMQGLPWVVFPRTISLACPRSKRIPYTDFTVSDKKIFSSYKL